MNELNKEGELELSTFQNNITNITAAIVIEAVREKKRAYLLKHELIDMTAERDALLKELRRIMPDRKVADEAQTERQELK